MYANRVFGTDIVSCLLRQLHVLSNTSFSLQKTYHSLFRPLLMLLGNDLLIESYPPTNNDTPFQRTVLSMLVTKPRYHCTFVSRTKFEFTCLSG